MSVVAEALADVIEMVRVCVCCGIRLPPSALWVRVIRPDRGPLPYCVTCAATKNRHPAGADS